MSKEAIDRLREKAQNENTVFALNDICREQRRHIESLQAELNEQCRLNGMGAEREARLLARVEELERAARMALEALIYCEALNSDVERQKIEAVNDLREMLGEKK